MILTETFSFCSVLSDIVHLQGEKMTRDTKTFRNPTGYWRYNGTYVIKLNAGADLSIVPSSATVHGSLVRVPDGKVRQSMGGIQFYSGSDDAPFYWPYRCIITICDSNGDLIWVNNQVRG